MEIVNDDKKKSGRPYKDPDNPVSLFKHSTYRKLDENNVRVILAVQTACLDIVKICATTIKGIRAELKRLREYEGGCSVRLQYMNELNEAGTMLKRAVDTFKGVQPDANKDVSDAMLAELTEIREKMEQAQREAQ